LGSRARCGVAGTGRRPAAHVRSASPPPPGRLGASPSPASRMRHGGSADNHRPNAGPAVPLLQARSELPVKIAAVDQDVAPAASDPFRVIPESLPVRIPSRFPTAAAPFRARRLLPGCCALQSSDWQRSRRGVNRSTSPEAGTGPRAIQYGHADGAVVANEITPMRMRAHLPQQRGERGRERGEVQGSQLGSSLTRSGGNHRPMRGFAPSHPPVDLPFIGSDGAIRHGQVGAAS
jgi:hypothetical protein